MYTSPQMIIHRKQSVLIYIFLIVIMISKAEPCSVVAIQNQLTLCIGTAIVRQIPVARKLKLLFGDCADARNKIGEIFWKQNYADAVHVLWISSSLWILCLNYLKFWHGLYTEWRIWQKKKKKKEKKEKKKKKEKITDRPSD